jgi:hypothetical protein
MKKINKKKFVNNNFSKLITKEHTGKWVAVSTDYKKIFGYSNNLQDLTKKDFKKVVYLKALSSDMQYSFSM